MKPNLLRLLPVAVLLYASALRAEVATLFSPEPPEAGAATLMETYLPLLVEGRFDQALGLYDLRGLRQYLLERRLNELKVHNPELTAGDLEEISARLQMNELNPNRLRSIQMDLLKEGGYEGMEWSIRGYAPAPDIIDGYLVSIQARTGDGRELPLLRGIKKLGEDWLLAPEIVEDMAGRRGVGLRPESVPAPAEVGALMNTFWTHWRAGELNEAYALLGPEYRARVSQLAFLQQAQDFMATAGVPASWKQVKTIETAPATLWMGVQVQGSITSKPTIMQFKQMGQTWIIEDFQFQMPRGAPPRFAPPRQATPFRTDLQPDLKPALSPPPARAPLPPPARAPAASGPDSPTKPEGPVGPDAP